VDDQERHDGDKEKSDDLLYDAPANKGQHYSGSLICTATICSFRENALLQKMLSKPKAPNLGAK